jgi:hypothetical protein
MHKVGDTVWVFDDNVRRFRVDANGEARVIASEKFRPRSITGETSRSWLIGNVKIPKHGGPVRTSAAGRWGATIVYMTQEAVDDEVFRREHRHRIVRALETCGDVAVLRQVAALVGYKAEE